MTSRLTKCLRQAKVSAEDAADIRAAVREAGGDDVRGVQAYLTERQDNLADLRSQLEDAGFDFAVQTWGEEATAAPTPTTEAGAEGLPQFVIPGTEQSATQAMQARDDKGGQRGKGQQKAADEGLFAPPEDARQTDIEGVQPPTSVADALAQAEARDAGLPDNVGARKYLKAREKVERLEKQLADLKGPDEVLAEREADHAGTMARIEAEKERGWEHRLQVEKEQFNKWKMERRNDNREALKRISEDLRWAKESVSRNKPEYDRWLASQPKPEAAAPAAAPPAQLPPGYGGSNTVFTSDAAERARAIIRARLKGTQLNAGFDPELMMAGLQLAGYHVEAGARSFTAYAKAMVDDMGAAVGPYLKQWYNAVRDHPGFDATGMTPYEIVAGTDIAPFTTSAPAVTEPAAAPEPEQQTAEPEPTDTDQPRTDAQKTPIEQLAEHGLVLSEKTSRAGKKYWAVTGDTMARKDVLDAAGFGMPFKMEGKWWRSYHKGDPTQPLLQALGLAEAPPPAAPLEITQEHRDRLRNAKLRLGQTKAGTFLVTGDTYELKDVLRDAGGRFNKAESGWEFTDDPTARIATALAGRDQGAGAGQDGADNADAAAADAERERLEQLRREQDARTDERALGLDVEGLVAPETRDLLRAGLKYGIPVEVVDDQIEDVALIANAYQKQKPLFLLANEAGTGKTFVLGGAIRELRRQGARKFLYVTMNQDLIEQIKRDLAAYGVDDVNFRTYSELSGRYSMQAQTDANGAVVIFDESHNVKNVAGGTARADVGQLMAGQARFTIFSSATPFENPVQARYLQATGIFDQVGGFDQWAKAYGASVRRRKFFNTNTGRKEVEEIIYWSGGKAKRKEAAAARVWMFRQGVMTQRSMRLDPTMVDVSFVKEKVEQRYVDMYEKVDEAYGRALNEAWGEKDEEGVGEGVDPMLRAEIARHRENTIKRLLEAAKIPFAIARAKAHHARGRSVVIFVETKAERELGRFRRSQHFKDDTLYTYPEMLALMDEYFFEKDMAKLQGGDPPRRPFADFILRIARNFHEAGISYELPSTAEEITAALGGVDKVAQYHGGVTDSRARKDKTAFLAGEKPFLVATMAKGGTGLSLHDTKGNRPTSQVNVNLPWVAQQVDQVSGRVARYGLQSRAEIEWIFSENIPWESSVLAPKIAGRMSDMGAVVKGIQTRAADALADFDFTGTISVKGSEEIDTDAADPTATGPYAQAFRDELSRGQPMDTRNGFFETPYPLSMLISRVAGVSASDRVLEPSAGHGSLLRYVPAGAKVTAVEMRPDNASVLRMRYPNARVEPGDFRDWSLALNPNARFDTILMNPPFERVAAPVGSQDIWHVQQAYEHLAPGGRLVAILGEGAFFRSYKQELAFRQWLDDVGATVVRLPEGSFRASGTMVRARMIVVDRDGTPGRSDINLSDLDADALLAIEAEIPTRRQVEPSAELVETAAAEETRALEAAPMSAQDDSPADVPDVPTAAQVEADDAAAAEQPEVDEPQLPLDDKPVPAEKKVKLSDRIEDAGEKIGGARKDLWAGRAITLDDLEGMNAAEEQQFVGKDAIWPKMDYAAMVGAGAEPEAVAMIKIIRDRLAAKPEDSADGRRNYIRMMEMVRDAAAAVKTVADVEAIRDRMHKALGYPESFQARTSWSREERRAFNALYQSIQKEGAKSDPLDIGYDERSKARAMVKAGFPGEMKAWQKKWSLIPPSPYGKGNDNWAIVETAARRILATGFATEDEAAAAADKLWGERTKKDGERLPERPHLDVLRRTGADVRGGRDIDSPDFLTDFGFRAVEFGNWVAGDERQKIVNLAYEGMHDLARALNLPPMALSLDGTMALAFGARGKGGKGAGAAHYEPGRLVINLTKISGAGSLAHEWAHALDHYLGELDRDKGTKGEAIYASGGHDRTSQRTSFLRNLRLELAETINDLMRAIYSANKTKAERVRDQELKLEKQQAEFDRVHEQVKRLKEDRQIFAADNPARQRQYDKTIAHNRQWLHDHGGPAVDRIRKKLAELREMPDDADFGMVESSFYEEAKKLSGKSGEKGYWARPTELWARTLEAYVFDRIGAEGNVSQYLVHGVEAERFATASKGNPYPAGVDRERIGKAFDALFAQLKVRTGQSGKPALYALPRFYSALHRAVSSYPQKGSMPALQWLGIIKNMKGVKPAELKWSGVEAWLETRGGKVTRDEIAAFLKASEPDVSEKVLGAEVSAQARILDYLGENADRRVVYEIIQDAVRGDARAIQELRDMDVPQVMLDRLLTEGPQTFSNNRKETAKYEDYTVPGAENYREVLLQMPADGQWPPPIEWRQRRGYEGDTVYEDDGNNVVIRALQNGRFILESPGGLRDLYPSLDAAKRRAEEMIDHIDGRRRPDANPNVFVGAHWDNNFNVVLHLRLSDRVDAQGRRTLFVEEAQSDWHREGRKRGYVKPGDRRDVASVREKFREYAKRWSPFAERRFGEAATANSLAYQLARNTDPEVLEEISNAIGMPWLELQEDANLLHDVAIGKRLDPKDIDDRVLDAPFKEEWAELGMKTAIRMAVEGGYDAVGWAPGKVHKDRYSLAKQVNSITYSEEGDYPGYNIRVRGFHGRDLWAERGASIEQIEKTLGKDVAEKIRNGVGQPVSEGSTARKLSGLDLEMGGEWADALYDRAIPRFLDKFVKPMGGKVGTTSLHEGTRGDRSISVERRMAAAISGEPWVVYDPAENEIARFATELEAENYLTTAVDEDREGWSIINDGARVDRPGQPIWTLPITDGMRETVQQVGLPLWARQATVPDGSLQALGLLDVANAADDALTGAGADAINGFVGMGPRAAERGVWGGMMNPDRLERAYGGPPTADGVEARRQIEAAFTPVREALRKRFGNTVRLYRSQYPIQGLNGRVAGGRNVLSWTSDPRFARNHAGMRGVARDIEPITDEQIAEAIATYERTDEVTFGRKTYKRSTRNPGFYEIYERGIGHVTDGDDLEFDLRMDQEYRQELVDKDAASRQRIVYADVPIDDVVWVTDRANQAEFIVRNSPDGEVYLGPDGSRQGVAQYRLTPDYQAKEQAVVADLEARLKAVGLSERIALAVRERVTVSNDRGILELEGRYFRGLIEVALNRGDQTWTLNHEIVHAMRDLGIIRDAEWTTLERAVRADGDRLAEVRARYGQAGNWSEEQLVEEAIADMFADWVRGRSETRGFIQSAFDRIRAFFEALRAALTGQGFTTADQIFRQVDTGRMGRRRTAEESALEAEPAFMTGWHGTPHEVDRFRTDRIGTGEGAQAFGWGLYFAGRREIAQHYRERLTWFRSLRLNGKGGIQTKRDLRAALAEAMRSPIQRFIRRFAGSQFDEAYNASHVISSMLDWGYSDAEIVTAARTKGFSPRSVKAIERVLANLDVDDSVKGNLYQVELAPTDAEMLAWDAPLSEQSAAVKEALRRLPADLVDRAGLDLSADEAAYTGREIYEGLREAMPGRSAEATSRLLLEVGIPGIRYLDGMSRADGAGESNYVIFDESAVSITARYALPRLRRGVERLTADAQSMSSWKDWYQRHQDVLKELFDGDADLFQSLLSATSQMATVQSNVALALKAYGQLKAGQPFTGYLPSAIMNLERVAAQQRLAGPKISAYGDANTGDKAAVAVDRHVSELLFGTKVPTRGMIQKAQETVTRVARKLGWEPRQVQAALWAFNQVRKGMDPANVQSYDTLLLAKRDAIAALRSSFDDAGGPGEGLRGRGDPGAGADEGARGDQPRRRGQGTSADAILAELRRRRGTTVDEQGDLRTQYRGISGPDATRLPGETWTDSEAIAEVYSRGPSIRGRGTATPQVKRAKIAPRNPAKLDSTDDGFVEPQTLLDMLGMDWDSLVREMPELPVFVEDVGHEPLSEALQMPEFNMDSAYFEAWRALDQPAVVERLRQRGYDAATYWGPFTNHYNFKDGLDQGSFGAGDVHHYASEVRIIDPAIVKPVTLTPPTTFDVKAGKPQPGRARRDKARRRNATRAWHQLQTQGAPTPRYAIPRVGARQGSLINYDLLGTIRAMGAENRRWIAKVFGRKAASNVAAQLDLARHRFQDRFIRVRRLQEAAERVMGRPLTEAEQAYLAEEGFASKVGERKFRIDMDYKLPIAEAMKAAGLSIDEVDTYLMARHAQERNEQIARINPRMPDGGSGMTTADADAVLAGVATGPVERREALERIAELVDGLLADALAWKVESGLLQPEAAQRMRDTYGKYVPLRGVPEDPDAEVQESIRPVTGVGFMGSRRKERRAFGRPTPAEDVLATALTIADEAAVRGEKNIVAQALLNLARNVPDDRVWEVNAAEMRAYLADETYEEIDPATGRKVEKKRQVVRYRRQPHYSPKDTVAVFVGGREFRIKINDPLLLREIERMGGVELNAVLQRLSQFTQWLSRLNTGLNPEFMITNMFRDIQAALVNISKEEQAGIRRDMVKNWRAARKGYFHYVRTGKTDTPMAALARDFREHGGAVAYNQTTDVEQQVQQLEELAATFRGGPIQDVKKHLTTALQYIEDHNNAVDAAIRMATYKALVDRGISKAKAASVAKNLTVNFNRRGEYGSALNALFMFYNAAMQGTAVLFSAMKHPTVRKLALAAAVTGMAQELLYGLLLDPPDEDDDEEGMQLNAYERIPDFIKQRNLIIMNPGYVEGTSTPIIGTPYFTIPMPLGYNLFHNVGRVLAGYARGARGLDGQQMSQAQAISTLMRASADSVLPSALSGYLVPTFAQPFVDVARNEDFFERPIAPTRMPNDNRPDSQMYYPTVSGISKETARLLNQITGGDEWRAGLIDISPESIDHVASTYVGAAGSLVGRLINRGYTAGQEVLGNNAEDPEFGVRDIPFLRKLFGYNSPGQQRDATYQRMAVIEALVDEAKAYADPKSPNPDALAELRDASGPLLQLKDEAGKLREFLSNSRRQRIATLNNTELSPAEQRDRLNSIVANEQLRMRGFNLRYMAKLKETEER